jgi:hypothetical protein
MLIAAADEGTSEFCGLTNRRLQALGHSSRRLSTGRVSTCAQSVSGVRGAIFIEILSFTQWITNRRLYNPPGPEEHP